MKIAIATDAWPPQISGVVTTLTTMVEGLCERGHEILVVHPNLFSSVPCPTYRTIPLALAPYRKLAAKIDAFQPDFIQVPTEGPVGMAGRKYALRHSVPFATAFTTKWPEYVNLRTKIPVKWGYAYLRKFHGAAACTMVSTDGVREELQAHGFKNIVRWSRGVNAERFKPTAKDLLDVPRPIYAYMGRVAVEKNLPAFLEIDLDGSKVVIGGGPALPTLEKRYPDAHFLGLKHGDDLAAHLAEADVFVFPSLTDTFGIVLIEAMACGIPVAAYPVEGPRDVVVHGETGWLDHDLKTAIRRAQHMDPQRCRQEALNYPWSISLDQFEAVIDHSIRVANETRAKDTPEPTFDLV